MLFAGLGEGNVDGVHGVPGILGPWMAAVEDIGGLIPCVGLHITGIEQRLLVT